LKYDGTAGIPYLGYYLNSDIIKEAGASEEFKNSKRTLWR